MKILVFIVTFLCYCSVQNSAADKGLEGLHYYCYEKNVMYPECCTKDYDCHDYIDYKKTKHNLYNDRALARLCDCEQEMYKCVRKINGDNNDALLDEYCFRESYPYGYEWVPLGHHMYENFDDKKGLSFLCQNNSMSKFDLAPSECCTNEHKCDFYIDRGESKENMRNTRQRARLCSCEDEMQKCLSKQEHSEAERIKKEYCIHEKNGKYTWMTLSEYQKRPEKRSQDLVYKVMELKKLMANSILPNSYITNANELLEGIQNYMNSWQTYWSGWYG